MKIGEIVTLLKAGYTRAEIQEMKNSESVTEQPAAIEPVSSANTVDAAPVDPIQPEPAPAVNDSHAEEIAELRRLVDNLTKLIQKQNLRDAEIPKAAPETAVDILGSIINPHRK